MGVRCMYLKHVNMNNVIVGLESISDRLVRKADDEHWQNNIDYFAKREPVRLIIDLNE